MNVTQLESKWLLMSSEVITSGYKSLRISTECIADLYLGINKDANRCLLLAVPESFKISINNIIKENLTIEYFPEKKYIVLQLTDNSFYDLFNDLIISLYHRIKSLSDEKEYVNEFILTLYKWSDFFEDRKLLKLSDDQIKGIFGELFFLRLLIKNGHNYLINEILKTWQGPFGKTHDFILDQKNVEIKTKDDSKIDIRISSEFQLQPENGKGLELLVLSVITDVVKGESLEDLVKNIRELIRERQGDFSLLLIALKSIGLNLQNLQEYGNQKFIPVSETVFNCMDSNFPKLINSELHEAISNVKYNIRLTLLDEFIISKKQFNYDN